MATLKFKRFTRPQVLRRFGRERLTKFLLEFEPQFRARQLMFPAPDLPETDWYGALARLLRTPEALPEEFSEAVFAIDEMAGPEGQEQLETAIERAGTRVDFSPSSSRADIALQVWLADRALLVRAHNEQRLRRLSAFEFFGTGVSREQQLPFLPPAPATLRELAEALDAWFARHQRGRDTTRVEVYPMDGEWWFLIRHGDTYARTPKVEAQRTEILHFRPERDDVVVYNPHHDEIRVNTRTRGERDLYVKQFGRFLRGREDYFSVAATFTLEPLRHVGREALDISGLEGINRIVLRELELTWDDAGRTTLTQLGDDLFGCVPGGAGLTEAIPQQRRLLRAGFDFHFADGRKPRWVQLRLPNILRVGRHGDASLVDRWVTRRGFRLRQPVE